MPPVSEDLYSLLVPLDGDWLLVPRSTVAEVIRFGVDEYPGETEDWLIGQTTWNNLEIPVVSLEQMSGIRAPEPGGRTRIVVIRPVSGRNVGPYGLLAEGFPQMVRVSREVLEVDGSYNPNDDVPLICRVQMLQEQALIPDLEMVEQRLAETAAA